jgi:hypothetical protein
MTGYPFPVGQGSLTFSVPEPGEEPTPQPATKTNTDTTPTPEPQPTPTPDPTDDTKDAAEDTPATNEPTDDSKDVETDLGDITFSGIADGSVVDGTIYVTAKLSGVSGFNNLEFYIDGRGINRERTAPYTLGGDVNGRLKGYDTTKLSDGTHTLEARLNTRTGTESAFVTFTVANNAPIATRVITTANLNVRSTANGALVGQQPVDSLGTITNQARTTTAGFDWVYVDFDTAPDGWVADEFISETLTTSTNAVDQAAVLAQIQQLLALIVQLQAQLDAMQAVEG